MLMEDKFFIEHKMDKRIAISINFILINAITKKILVTLTFNKKIKNKFVSIYHELKKLNVLHKKKIYQFPDFYLVKKYSESQLQKMSKK